MALTRRNEDKLGSLPNGIIQVRVSDIIEDDGEHVATNYSRYVLTPGDDVSGQSDEIQAVASALWTAEKVAAYTASLSVE